MEKTLDILNQLEAEGVVTRYAIGGAIAATFYMEPVLTYDLDVFVSFPSSPGSILILSPLYEYLQRRGYGTEREYVVIEGVPVQFLPAYNPLVQEALGEAREVSYGETKTRVLRAEHLLAIMLQTYRPKDKTRMVQMLEEAEMDLDYLTEILKRHDLHARWEQFKRQFDAR